MTTDLRALVLAAGHGRRLRPLTATTPKPLLPILGRPILLHTLEALSGAGIERVAINLHHEGEAITRALGSRPLGLEVTYSHEEDLLGTLGALVPLEPFWRDADALLVINGDSLCRWPLKALIRRHLKAEAAATLLLLEKLDPASYGGGVGLDSERRIRSLRPGREVGEIARRHVFAGAHLLDPRRLPDLGPGELNFVPDLWEPWLRQGVPIASVTTRRPWHDLGTPGRYLAGALDWIPWWRSNWEAADLDGPRRRWRRVVAEEGVTWEERTRLRDGLLLPGCHLGPRCDLERVVVGPQTRVPAGTRISDRLLTRPRAGLDPPPGTSRLGELWVSPLEPDTRSS
ncbi:MAG: NDP-sugar synthase [Thermoanaerobaculia bacterium]|nr:NDP-sugar synthase [Thermoanaerobaculia bacterium]